MEFRQMSYFVTIVDENSFTIAAKKLHISQPALSRMLNSLESQLNCKLIERKKKKIKLTEQGIFLYNKAKKVVEEFEELKDDLNTYILNSKDIVLVGIPPVVGTFLVSSVVGNFIDEYPEVKVLISEQGAKLVQKNILEDKLNIGFTPLPLSLVGFNVFPIYEDEMDVIVHKNHHFVKHKSLSLNELSEENFILFDDTFALHDYTIQSCRNSGFEPKIFIKSGQWDFILEMVALKKGIAIMPRPIANRYKSDTIVKIPMKGEVLKWKIAIISKYNRQLNKSTKLFIEYTKSQLLSSKHNL